MVGYADPFEPLDPLRAMMERRIGQNTGNLIFTASVMRNLMTPVTEVVQTRGAGLKPDVINEQYDHFVLPLANAFRPDFIKRLDRYSKLIEKLTIPVTVLGVGAQTTLDDDWSGMQALAPHVKRFVSAVLNRGPSIGVRGDATKEYLGQLGFSDVVTIGCPSMYFHGEQISIDRGAGPLTKKSLVSINLTPRRPLPAGYVLDHLKRFPQTTYVAQDQADLRVILGGAPIKNDPEYPSSLFHPLLRDDKTQLFLNAQVWIDHMASQDFAFGTRIHGNVAAVLAGVPAHVIAHDSRTRELAEYYEIPHTLISDMTPAHTADRLFEESDWTNMVTNHPIRYRRFTDFLDRHNLDHMGRHRNADAPFDLRTREANLGPEHVITVRGTDVEVLSARVLRSTLSSQRRLEELEAQVTQLTHALAQRETPPQSFSSRLRDRLRRRPR